MEPDDKVMDFQVKEGGKVLPPPSVEQVQVALQLLGMKLPEGSPVQFRAQGVILDFLRR